MMKRPRMTVCLASVGAVIFCVVSLWAGTAMGQRIFMAYPTPSPTASATPYLSPTPVPSPTPTLSPTPTATSTATPLPTATPEPTPLPEPTAVPTARPTLVPKVPKATKAPVAVATAEPQTPVPGTDVPSHIYNGEVPESAPVNAAYFDQCVFIGDSVSLKLSHYEASKNVLGDALFLTSGSFSTVVALSPVTAKSVHPAYKGTKSLVEDAVALSGKKQVYIMLGMNDIGRKGHTLAMCVDRMEQVCDRILAKSPDVTICIESMTPVAASTTLQGITNDKVIAYNQLLCELCRRRGWHFVNVSSVFYDSAGYLNRSYCSDYGAMGIHFTNAGCEAWVRYLYTHTV